MNGEFKEILKNYTKSLEALDDYDHDTLVNPSGTVSPKKITVEGCIEAIKTAMELENSYLYKFHDVDKLNSIINEINRTYNGEAFFVTSEEKAANFLYLIVKERLFGNNQKFAATLFIYILDFYGILTIENRPVICGKALVPLIILIDKSEIEEKQRMLKLTMRLISIKCQG